MVPSTGLAGHVENINAFQEYFVPLYFNYFEYAQKLIKEARREGLVPVDLV